MPQKSSFRPLLKLEHVLRLRLFEEGPDRHLQKSADTIQIEVVRKGLKISDKKVTPGDCHMCEVTFNLCLNDSRHNVNIV